MKAIVMEMKKRTAGKVGALILCAILAISFTGCAQAKNTDGQVNTITTLADLEGKTIGSLVGTSCLEDAAELAGESGKALGFNMSADLPQALQSNKIDAIVIDGSVTMKMIKEYPNFKQLDEVARPIQYGFIFSKTNPEGEVVRQQFNEYIAKIQADGTLAALWDKWTAVEDTAKTVDYSKITGENGKISVATSSISGEPCVYMKNGELVGIDIDLVVHFCAEYGYEPDIIDMDFSGLIAGITTNKYLLGASAITITEERAESVNFTEPYYDGGVVAIVKTADTVEAEDFWTSLTNGFNKTFIAEGRWQLFAKGAGITLFISLSSLILGTLLGFVVFMYLRKGGKIRNKIANACISVISGMPAIVLLMILFYIVFSAFSVDGEFVSIVAFTLIFAAGTIGILRSGTEAINEGQTEAGCALGYTELQTFGKIVLPQVIKLSLPSYQSQVKELLKGTAVVGYIAVQDLTKMGDIVRSATYEAIYPLIAVAIVYFLLEILLKYAIQWVNYYFYERKHKHHYLTKGLVLTAPYEIDLVQDHSEQTLDIIKQSLRENLNSLAEQTEIGEKTEIVRFEHLYKAYTRGNILEDINLTIYKGDVVSVIGPSGCGKSTLLRCLNFLDPPTSGKIYADGIELTKKGCNTAEIHKHIGTVFQRWNLFDHWTVIENLMRPQMDLLHLSRQEAYNRAMRSLVTFGLYDKPESYPNELSGGQQQRIAIIRTLLLEPSIIVLDEPTSALDPRMVGQVQTALSYLAKTGVTMLIVSHDMNFLRNICNRVVYLDQKRVYEEGTVEQIFEHPSMPLTKAFINQAKTKTIVITSKKNDVVELLSNVDEFCTENNIDSSMCNRLKDAFITLGLQIILPHMQEEFEISAVLVYYEKKGTVSIAFFYDGEIFNPETTEKKELWKELMDNVDCFEYHEHNEFGYTNWAICIVKY